MRVLMLSWEYPPHVVGGLGRHVMELVPALAGQDVELHLVTPGWAGGAPREQVDGATVYHIDPPSGPLPDIHTTAWQTSVRLQELAQNVCQERSIELIHNHDWLTAFAATALKRNFKLPLLSTIHATERGRARGRLQTDLQRAINSTEWWLTYESWRVICCSQFMARETSAYFQTPADKIDIIPNGVSTAHFDRWSGADLSRFRSMYALPEEKIVLSVGRIVQEKGQQVLIEAAPQVLREHPKAKFVITGTGGLLDTLRRRAWELGVGDKVLFTGFVSDEDRDRLFKVASCAVFPSLYEPFGIVALEAMAARTPVVVSLVGGLQEVVTHAKTGITVYPDNAESLAWGISHTLSRPDWAAQRAEAAYRLVQQEYNWTRIAQLTADVYRRIIAERAQMTR